ncbi:MAG: tRNA (adenosine(37)-N6)-threonylcarbamoyltransferase complex dimerization subunit type 1 TsaB [Clostridiales bacterium]|nr:tRNA (adenosine(37)-N6)-threonylcarbamoyltransferase complex dimerization subunit type 1 TsaB [Clostridiales bacterium]
MIILAADTSNSTCCAGVYRDGDELAFELSLEKRTHSETFMPLVERVVEKSGITYGDIDAIAVTVGPGSFTGIRIGLSAVKGMAYAVPCPLIPVSSTKALAGSSEVAEGDPSETLFVPSFDARNKRVFASVVKASDLTAVVEEGAFDAEDLAERIKELKGRRKVIVLGNGADTIRNAAQGRFEAEYAPGAVILPRGIYNASRGTDPVGAEACSASYCAVSSAERLRK